MSDAPNLRSLEYTTSNTRLTLKCRTAQSPPTNVTWLKNWEKLTIDGNRTQMSQHVLDRSDNVYETTLTIVDHPYDYIGNYTCFVGNLFGNDTKELSIQGTKYASRCVAVRLVLSLFHYSSSNH